MINDAIGKILGMAMAYGVSALGLFLAYVNYRRRIVKADRVMTPAAWLVMAAIAVAVVGGIAVVATLAQPPTEPPPEAAAAAATEPVPPPMAESAPAPAGEEQGARWPLVGILLPAVIFLAATWITAGLYRHFSHPGH